MRSWILRPPAMDKAKAKKILFEVKEVLDRNDVEFFLNLGTCLGAVREGGFIDEDFDIDLGIKHSILLPKLGSLAEQFKKLGYDIKFLSTPYSYDRMIKLDKDDIRVDLLNWDLHVEYFGDSVCSYYFHPINPNGMSHVFQREMFDNLKEIEFLGQTFNIPVKAEEYLRLIYKDNWREKGKYDFKLANCLVYNYYNRSVKPARGER